MIFSPVPSSLHVGRVRGEKWSPAEGRKRPGVATANLAHQGHSQSNMCPPPPAASCLRLPSSSLMVSLESGTTRGSSAD